MKIPVIWPDNLPEITVKTAPDSRTVRKDAPRQSGGKGSTSRHVSSKPAQRPASAGTGRQDKGNGTSRKNDSRTTAKSLGRMSEAERMKYYKEKYGFEPAGKNKEKAVSEPVKNTEKNAVKKPGFFARLFGLGRKKQ